MGAGPSEKSSLYVAEVTISDLLSFELQINLFNQAIGGIGDCGHDLAVCPTSGKRDMDIGAAISISRLDPFPTNSGQIRPVILGVIRREDAANTFIAMSCHFKFSLR
jgi:hypothetical protein